MEKYGQPSYAYDLNVNKTFYWATSFKSNGRPTIPIRSAKNCITSAEEYASGGLDQEVNDITNSELRASYEGKCGDVLEVQIHLSDDQNYASGMDIIQVDVALARHEMGGFAKAFFSAADAKQQNELSGASANKPAL